MSSTSQQEHNIQDIINHTNNNDSSNPLFQYSCKWNASRSGLFTSVACNLFPRVLFKYKTVWKSVFIQDRWSVQMIQLRHLISLRICDNNFLLHNNCIHISSCTKWGLELCSSWIFWQIEGNQVSRFKQQCRRILTTSVDYTVTRLMNSPQKG